MTENRVAKLEATAVEDPRIRAAREATMPKTKTRTIVLHDDEQPPAAKPGQKRILVRVISTGHRSKAGLPNERVLPRFPGPGQAGPATEPRKNDRPAERKPEAEVTIPDLEAELAALEAEEARLLRRTP